MNYSETGFPAGMYFFASRGVFDDGGMSGQMDCDHDAEYEKLKRVLPSGLTDLDHGFIENSFHLAFDAHSDQKRKDGKNYFVGHVLPVALILINRLGSTDPLEISMALLHDTIEDSKVFGDTKTLSYSDSAELVRQNITGRFISFGELGLNIADKIINLSKPKVDGREIPDKIMRNKRYKEILSGSPDSVVKVKLADRIHNAETLKFLSRDKQEEFVKDTIGFYLPLFRERFEDNDAVVRELDKLRALVESYANTSDTGEEI